MSEELVLVTGGSGFIGAHCILQLLNAGYRVRTTVRSLKREADVRAMLRVGGAAPGESLSFVAADQTRRRPDRARARRCAPGAARGARGWRKAGCADLLIRGDWLWTRAAGNTVQRNRLD